MYYDDPYQYGGNYVQYDFSDRQPIEGYFIPPPGEIPYPGPMGPPPYFSPPFPAWQEGPGGIRMCLYHNTYIWLINGISFWFFPTFVSRNRIGGYLWRGFSWVYNEINTRTIRSYICYP